MQLKEFKLSKRDYEIIRITVMLLHTILDELYMLYVVLSSNFYQSFKMSAGGLTEAAWWPLKFCIYLRYLCFINPIIY